MSQRTGKAGSHNWGTPEWLVDVVHDVMGRIDLDPASTDEHNERVKAGLYYTKEMDGLTRQWSGKVWCNPPYGRGELLAFTTKWKEHCLDIEETMWIMNAVTDTRAGQMAIRLSDLIFLPNRRVQFIDPRPGRPRISPTLPQMILWKGPAMKEAAVASRLGMIGGQVLKHYDVFP